MAKSKSKTVVKKETKVEKKADAPLTTKAAQGSPYQLDAAQVERAATALVAHMKKHAEEKQEKGKKSLTADEDDAEENDQPIFLSVSTKKHVHDTSKLKPTKLPIPHSIQPSDVRICIFTKDPQRAYKDLVASDAFPADVRAKVARVLGVEKLKKKFKSFEQKRALLAEYDLFMVDDRIIKIAADFLGKTFYQSKSKRPVPIRLTAGAKTEKDKKSEGVIGTPQGVAKEIENALNATYVSMSASANTSIKVGKLSMTPGQLKDNVEAVVTKVVEKHIEHGWRNVRSLHIKGPTTKALPIWLADELWTDDAQVLDKAWQPAIKDGEKASDKKRKWEEWEEELLDDEVLAKKKAGREAKKNKKEPEEKKASSISKEKRKKLKKDALKDVQTPLIASS
ncbi:ribosomal protein L1 [Corynespora cassiicola Philippines]|uniref:Ribosomal protein L1 n=1 Tax=Corynespora cassiicola Philippines TaxID=1448308 RepID=A0A2T2P0V0_CORCC|nr:ribosomal protein L1 [Corynespora cassiicola Philippines]